MMNSKCAETLHFTSFIQILNYVPLTSKMQILAKSIFIGPIHKIVTINCHYKLLNLQKIIKYYKIQKR